MRGKLWPMTDQKDKIQSATPTISRASDDQIVELVYDAHARTTALAVHRQGSDWQIRQTVTLASGEMLRPYSAQNNLIANACVLLPSKPESYGSKESLINEIAAYLHRYVDLSPVFENIAAHYVLLTWVYDAFQEVPYLRFQGDYGTGKTRALLALGSICYKPFFASGASSVSPIFHILEAFGGTLILDEADLRFSDATGDLIKILNNGTVRGLPVLRTIVDRNKEYNPRAFKVFGPKIVAMRGAYDDDALESRFVSEQMGQRSLRDGVPIALPDTMEKEALSLRDRLLDYRAQNLATLRTHQGPIVGQVEPRVAQMASPLLRLIDDETLKAETIALMRSQNAQLRVARRRRLDGMTIIALNELFATSAGHAVSVGALTGKINGELIKERDIPVTPKAVGNVLRALHLETRRVRGVYVVPAPERPKAQALLTRVA